MTDLERLAYAAKGPPVSFYTRQLPDMLPWLQAMLIADGRDTLRAGAAAILNDELVERLRANAHAWLSQNGGAS